MRLIFILVTCASNAFQIIESKPYRVYVEDKILPYYDNSISSYLDYFSVDNLILEQVDDDNVQIGGYLEVLKEGNRNLPLTLNIRTQYYEKAKWNEGAYRLTVPNGCLEFINPQRVWYNITKLWTLDVCPPKLGDKLEIETNQINILTNVPSLMPIVPWRFYLMGSQGLPGFEKYKYGFGIQIEFLRTN